MKTLAIKAVVTSADGFYYREEHEWRNMDQAASDKMTAHQKRLADYITKASQNKQHGPLVADLTGTADGVALPAIHVDDLSYGELNGFQREFAKLGNEWLDAGKAHADKKDKKK